MSVIRFARSHRVLTPLLAVGLLLVGAGSAIAALGINTVGGAQVRNEGLSGADIKNGTLFSADIKDGGLLGLDVKADALTGRQISERTLNVPTNISSDMTAVDVANAAAGAATPEVTLLSRGNVSLTATCWRQADTGVLHADLFLSSRVNGALMQGTLDAKSGGNTSAGFLNIDTPRAERQVASPDTANNTFRLFPGAAGAPYDLAAWAPNGDYMRGNVSIVTQNGVVPGVTGPLGSGNKCHVVGFISAVAI
ncbi:MAG: hypothetical protein JWM98_1171 [Thermoleophilia bacterium]|nr:hypothetical protein [Thermoleophilia bacterium]